MEAMIQAAAKYVEGDVRERKHCQQRVERAAYEELARRASDAVDPTNRLVPWPHRCDASPVCPMCGIGLHVHSSKKHIEFSGDRISMGRHAPGEWLKCGPGCDWRAVVVDNVAKDV